MKQEGVKFDEGKPRWDLLPVREIEQVVKVLTAGAGKYADNNWQLVVADNPRRYIAAHGRHMAAWAQGRIYDDGPRGDGLPHLAHAICNLLFLLWNDNEEETMTSKERNILERMEDKVDQLMGFMATSNERAKGCERRFHDIEVEQKERDKEARRDTKKLYLLYGAVGLIGALAGPFLAALFRKLLQVI